MNITRRQAVKLAGLALALSGSGLPAFAHDSDDDDGLRSGKVFTISNAADHNEVLIFDASAGGALQLAHRVPTSGQGTGQGLGSQGAVTLSGDGRFLFAVNSASNTVSTFAVRRHELSLRSVVPSGGLGPISVTEHDGIVYVLNAQGAGNVAGFRNAGGELKAIHDGVRPLSAAGGTGPAQVGFDTEGELLVVAEKATNRLTTYRVRDDGRPGSPVVTPSAGMTPFGFAFNRRNVLLVSEAFGGAAGASAVSSYRFEDSAPATPMVVSPSVGTTQSAACWVAVTPDGRFAYTTNTGSGTVSSYLVARSGRIELLAAVAADTGAGSSPIDAAVNPFGRRLHVLNGGNHTISSFRVGHDGALAPNGSVGGLPAGAVGLAAN